MDEREKIIERQIKIAKEIEEFKKASEIKTFEQLRALEDRLMDYIVYIDVKCTYCKRVQKSTSYRQKKCVYCGKTFSIFPKGKYSRVADTEHNRKVKRYIHELASLIKRGKKVVL